MSTMPLVGLLLMLGSVDSWVTIHTVYYEMPPFIYYQNGVLKGMFPDIAKQARALCGLNISFSKKTDNASQFHALIHDHQANKKYVDEKWLWLSLVEYVDKQTLDRMNLKTDILFMSPGMEVVVHRDEIGILPKVLNGMNNSRYLIVMALLLSLIFGIIIWFIVRKFFSHYDALGNVVFIVSYQV